MSKVRSVRIDHIDLFKSFGIILMIMGHIGYGARFDHFIHAFHMPMFFWISGYLFKHRSKEEMSFWVLVIKKAKTLLLPYIIFGVAHYVLFISMRFIRHGDFTLSPLIHLFSYNTDGLAICGALWFLTALFFTDILFFLIDRYVSDRIVKAGVIALIAFLGNIVKTFLPFAMGVSFVGVGLYYLGYLCKKYEKKTVVHHIMDMTWITDIILGMITAILIFKNGYINMRTGIYANIPLFWTNAMLSTIVGVNLSKRIYPFIKNNLIGRWLTSIGRDSIIYVCLNQVVILLVTRYIGLGNGIAFQSVISIVVLSILLIMHKIIVGTKLKVLIGKSGTFCRDGG